MRPETRPDCEPPGDLRVLLCGSFPAGDGSRLCLCGPRGRMVPKGSEEVFWAVLHKFVAIHRGQKLTHRAESKARFHFHPLYENSVSTEGALCCICSLVCFLFAFLSWERTSLTQVGSGSFPFTPVFCCLDCKLLATGRWPTQWLSPEPCPLARESAHRKPLAKPRWAWLQGMRT